MDAQHVLLFGDQTTEVQAPIKSLIAASRGSSYLPAFLSDATERIRKIVFKLPRQDHQQLDSFADLETLADSVSEKSAVLNDVVRGILLYVVRIGNLILLAEKEPSVLSNSGSDIYILGLCTGLIPATVAASSKTAEDVVRVGLEVVPVMMRMLVELDRRTQEIQESRDSWSYTLTGFSSEDESAIETFNKKQSLSNFRQAYISVRGETWATITGPPSVLSRLWGQPGFKERTKIQQPIGIATHAPHLPELDFGYIIGDAEASADQVPASSHILVAETEISGCSLKTALQNAVQIIGQETLEMPQVLENLATRLLDSPEKTTVVSAMDPTRHSSLVERTLTDNDIAFTTQADKPVTSDLLSESVAIVGLSGRFPGGNSVQELWENLVKGLSLHKKVPADRFDIDDFHDPELGSKNTMKAHTAYFVDKPGQFDPSFFNISPREAMQMDPTQRLLLMSAYEALEIAGYTPDGTPSMSGKRIATYFGQVTDDWREINEQQGIDIYHIPGTMRIFAPGRLNYFFKWEGGSYSLDTACSGSSTAVHLACKALLAGDCDMALAGGGTIHASPMTFVGLSRGGFLSPGNGCQVFSADADGYARGDGVGVLVMKRLSDAIAEGDNIQAIIPATARNHSAYAKSITHPHSETQQRLYKSVMQRAGIVPGDISYVEMHGTGTQAGDSTEMDSVTKAIASRRPASSPLYVGGVKANVGHGEAAAGVTSIAKAIMMFRDNVIPPQVGMSTMKLNPKFGDLKAKNIVIAHRETPFQTGSGADRQRRILVNNFDAAGGNTAILLQEPPQTTAIKEKDPRSHHTVALSAKSSTALKKMKKQLLAHIKATSDVTLRDLAYTTTARRMHHGVRAAFTAETMSDFTKQLQTSLDKHDAAQNSRKPGKMVFVFTGQGSQYWGMGSNLFRTSQLFRETVLSCQRICSSLGWPEFVDIIRGDEDKKATMESKTTLQVQLAVVTIEMGLAKLWKSWGVQPDLVMGHSLGEYAALHTAGVLSMHDALYAVGTRATLVQERCTPNTYAMLAISASTEDVKARIAKHEAAARLTIACVNGPKAVVVSGPVEDIESMQEQLKADTVASTKLNLPYGFHSEQLAPILEDYEKSLEGITFLKPSVPVLSTMLASVITERMIFSPMYLAAQARQPVLFQPALEKCRSNGFSADDTQWLEIGPTPTCIKFVRAGLSVAPAKLLKSLEPNRSDWAVLSDSMVTAYGNGVAVNWVQYQSEYEKSLRLVNLPSYPFDIKEFWAPYQTKTAAPEETQAAGEAEASNGILQLSSTTLQYVQKEHTGKDGNLTVTFSSQTAEPNLFRIIQSHVVNEFPICPASGFCDMALTAAKHCWQKKAKTPEEPIPSMAVQNLEITNPIIAFEEIRGHAIQVTATMNMGSKNASDVQVNFTSNANGDTLQNASCKVVFGKSARDSLSDVHLIKSRVEVLTNSGRRGVDRLPKSVVYKLFAELVRYGPEYKGMQEVFTDTEVGDSVARVRLTDNTGSFMWNPFWLDTMVHISGFVLNGDPDTADDAAFVATGFENIELLSEVSKDKEYLSYTHMRPQSARKGSNFVGDVLVFDGDELVAICLGIKFIQSKRATLKAVFDKSTPKANATGKSKPSKPRPAPIVPTAQAPTDIVVQVIPDYDGPDGNFSSSESEASYEPTDEFSTSYTPGTSQEDLTEGMDDDVVSGVLNVIAKETGVGVDELEDSKALRDLGVDSMMIISLVGEIKKETGLELAATFLNSCETIGDVRTNLAELTGSKPKAAKPASKPKSSKPKSESKSSKKSSSKKAEPAPAAPAKAKSTSTSVSQAVMQIIAEETGTPASDLTDEQALDSIGVDSIMVITIVDRVKKMIDVEVPATIFRQHATIGAIREAIEDTMGTDTVSVEEADGDITRKKAGQNLNQVTSPTHLSHANMMAAPRSPAISLVPTARAILIQGKPGTSSTPVFCLPDGSGSAASYIYIPQFSSQSLVYALESPYSRTPADFQCSIEEMAASLIAGIRAVQPNGPYILAGWSAGGVFAYEVARLLLEAGQRITGFIVIDTRAPEVLAIPEDAPLDIVRAWVADLMRGSGFTEAFTPQTKVGGHSELVAEHISQTAAAMALYQALPMKPHLRPDRCFVLWADRGIIDDPENQGLRLVPPKLSVTFEDPALEYWYGLTENGEDEDTHLVKRDPLADWWSWFCEPRQEFGTNGWERYIGKAETYRVSANHFSIMEPPQVRLQKHPFILEAYD